MRARRSRARRGRRQRQACAKPDPAAASRYPSRRACRRRCESCSMEVQQIQQSCPLGQAHRGCGRAEEAARSACTWLLWRAPLAAPSGWQQCIIGYVEQHWSRALRLHTEVTDDRRSYCTYRFVWCATCTASVVCIIWRSKQVECSSELRSCPASAHELLCPCARRSQEPVKLGTAAMQPGSTHQSLFQLPVAELRFAFDCHGACR
jgi:hypothetical protein